MGPAEPQDIVFPDQRFSPGHHEGMDTQGFPLGHDLIHGFIGKIQSMAVFCCPAADAVHVADTGRVEQDGPGNIAMVFIPASLPGLQSIESRLKTQIHDSGFQDMGIERVQSPFHEFPPFSPLADQVPGACKRRFGKEAPKEFFHQVRKPEQGFFPFVRILYRQDMVNDRFNGFPFSIMDQLAFHDPSSPSS